MVKTRLGLVSDLLTLVCSTFSLLSHDVPIQTVYDSGSVNTKSDLSDHNISSLWPWSSHLVTVRSCQLKIIILRLYIHTDTILISDCQSENIWFLFHRGKHYKNLSKSGQQPRIEVRHLPVYHLSHNVFFENQEDVQDLWSSPRRNSQTQPEEALNSL